MPRSLESVLTRAAKLVTPSKSEVARLERVALRVRSILSREFDGHHVSPDLSLGGSYAKGTWLKGSADVDYFLLFPPDYPREKLEGEAIDSCRRALAGFRIEMRYAEHPYVESFVEGVRVNVVPCYKVEKGAWQSAADRSPFHAEYVRSRFSDEMKLEARLLKGFTKSSGTYGAEVKVQGFSGYVCEILTLKFGSFANVLQNLSKAAPGEVISVEDYDKELASSFKSSLVILDPVDTTRNLGSAISTENVAKLVLNVRRFLAGPSISYFAESKEKKRLPRQDLLSRTIVITFKNDERSVDILWGQLKKSVRSVSSKLKDSGYFVLRERALSDEKGQSAFVLLLLETRISDLKVRSGPEFFRAHEARRYLEKRAPKSNLIWINEEGRLLSLTYRENASTSAVSLLKEHLSDSRKLEKLGLSKAVKNELSRGFKIATASRKFNKPWLDDGIRSMLTSEV